MSKKAAASAIIEESSIRDYVSLLKPRVMSLVVFSGIVGLILAPGSVHPAIGFTIILCIAVGSGAAGAMNMWIERESDAKMKRTKNRALPAKRLDPASAIEFAGVLAVVSVVLLAFATNYLAAALLAFAIFYYVVIYTMWLKPRTPHNIVIGGAAGAFPPVIGWAGVTGDISIDAIILFAIIFMWTPPHFWALALFQSDDYKNANIPMLPVVAGVEATTKQMLLYTIILLPLTLAPTMLGRLGVLYGVGALLLSSYFIFHAARVHFYKDAARKEQQARRMFGYSILYLFALLTLMLVDYYA